MSIGVVSTINLHNTYKNQASLVKDSEIKDEETDDREFTDNKNVIEFKDELDISTKTDLRKLEAIEREVVAHEMAHMSAGGKFSGAPTYSYTQGPDGKRYKSGGEVQIKIVEGKTPDETIQNMEQVKRAALAPANPSPQDLSVASQASQIQARASTEKAKENSENLTDNKTEKIKNGFNVYENNGHSITNRLKDIEGLLESKISVYA